VTLAATQSDNDNLSGGEIAAIVIGVLVAIIILLIILIILLVW